MHLLHTHNKKPAPHGFTIVELIVVIIVIGILVGITIVGYGAWHRSTITAKVKSDLNSVISAMESARTFNNTYPSTVPTTVVPSSGVTLTGGSSDGTSYCVDGTSSEDSSIKLYVASETKSQGPLAGTCATRPVIATPGIPANLAVISAVGTSVGLSWVSVTGASSYTLQCAQDPGFVNDFRTASVNTPATTGTVGGLSPSTSYYCRINAVNSNGAGKWSTIVSTDTSVAYGSLPVASSIEGYWAAPPQGFLLEDGSAISRTAYAALFAVIGTTYGAGDGSTTFNLPDSRGRTSVNQSSDVEFATIGQKTGSKTEALTIAQMPSHTHIQNPHTHVATGRTDAIGAASGWGGVNTGVRSATSSYTLDNQQINVSSTTATNQYTGGNGGHNNIQPSIVKLAAIKYAPVDPVAKSLPAGSSVQGYWTGTPSSDYLLENGSAVSRTTYAALFAAIGTTYGAGDGSTTFNLPDSRGRAAVNLSPSDAEFNTMGEKYGTKAETITIATMPSHTHIQDPHSHSATGRTDAIAGASGWAGSNSASRASTNSYTLDNQLITVANTTATNQFTGGDGSHNNIQPSITKLSAIKITPVTSSGTDLATGTSLQGYWPVGTIPSGYLIEDGSAISRTAYPALFSVIGTTYGVGDGSTTFNVPDSRGRLGVNKSTDSEFAAIGEKYGEKMHTLTIAEMPSHTHIQDPHSHSATGRTDAIGEASGWAGVNSAVRAGTSSYTLDNQQITINSTTAVNQYTGGGGAHNEIQPSIVKLFIIKY